MNNKYNTLNNGSRSLPYIVHFDFFKFKNKFEMFSKVFGNNFGTKIWRKKKLQLFFPRTI